MLKSCLISFSFYSPHFEIIMIDINRSGEKNVGGIQIALLCPVLNDNVEADVSLNEPHIGFIKVTAVTA